MASLGLGSTLSGASTGTVGKIKNITAPEISVNMVESLNMDETTATYLIGALRRGPATFEIEKEGTTTGNYAKVKTACEGRSAEVWTITFANTSTLAFTGAISKLGGPSAGEEDPVTFPMEIQPTSGAITFTGTT